MLVGKKRVPIADYWLNHRERRQYQGIEFDPGGGRPGYFNMWHGWAVTPREGDCSKFLAHVKDNVAQGDDEIYKWVIGWFAQIFQQPAEKPGTALALRGKQGVGKTIVGKIIGELIGPRHYKPVSEPRYITGQFNAHMATLLLIHADEAFWAGNKQAEGKLKDMITGSEHLVEYKGIDPITIANYMRLFITGNHEWIVPAGMRERRFLVLDVGEGRIQDSDYFAAIEEEADNGGREALLHHLLNFDLSTVDLRKIPRTRALMEQQLELATPEEAWWFDTLMHGYLPEGGFETTCIRSDLHDRYVLHAHMQGVRHRASQTKLGMFLKKYVGPDLQHVRPTIDGKGRPHCYQFPPLKECRERFAKEMQQDIDWEGGIDKRWEFDVIPFGGSRPVQP